MLVNFKKLMFLPLLRHLFSILSVSILSISLCACQSDNGNNYTAKKKFPITYRTLSKDDKGNTKYKGHYKIGTPYKIKGKKYKPKEVTRYTRNGVASWYGKRYNFHGKLTANGDIFNKEMLTAAHKTLPLPSLVKVTNRENGKSIVVLVNDRGPFAYNREIDLSERAAVILGMRNKGTSKVKVQYLHKDTQKFLKILGLKKKTGSRTKKPLKNKKCTVNCHIKLMNIKYKLL